MIHLVVVHLIGSVEVVSPYFQITVKRHRIQQNRERLTRNDHCHFRRPASSRLENNTASTLPLKSCEYRRPIPPPKSRPLPNSTAILLQLRVDAESPRSDWPVQHRPDVSARALNLGLRSVFSGGEGCANQPPVGKWTIVGGWAPCGGGWR